jgi:hypothetical protein
VPYWLNTPPTPFRSRHGLTDRAVGSVDPAPWALGSSRLGPGRTSRPEHLRSCGACRVLPPDATAPPARAARCLPELCAPSALAERDSHVRYAGLASPGYGPPPGFFTLLTVCSAPDLPGLFHPGNAHGIAPFRASPPPGAVAPLGARCRLDVYRRAASGTRPNGVFVALHGTPRSFRSPVAPRTPTPARLHGFAPPMDPLPRGRGSAGRGARCSPGLCSSPGTNPNALAVR